MRMVLVIVLSALASVGAAAAGPLAGDGPGCKDKAVAAKLLPLDDTNPLYIEIWATGMRDGSCRGYSAGQEVAVVERAEGMACVRAADDEACFWVRESMAPKP